MAENKKSFLIYCDLIHTVEKLNDEDAGQLLKHILRYVNDMSPETDNPFVDLAFEPIKQQLKRDLKKYDNIRERNKINGSKGGRPKKPKKPTGLSGNPKKPKKADTDNDTVIDTVNDNVKEIFINWLEYREEIKKPINIKTTLSKLVNKFNNEPKEKVEFVVNLSIENGWQGLFWDKYTSSESSKSNKQRIPL